MRRAHARLSARLLSVLCFMSLTQAPASPDAPPLVAELESAYADFNDASGAVSLLDSDPQRYLAQGFAGRSRAEWQRNYAEQRATLMAGLKRLRLDPASPADARAVHLMRADLYQSAEAPDSLAPVGHCSSASQARGTLQSLQQALYACFAELGDNLQFEGTTVTRVGAFELLTRMEEPERREALFRAFVPLWQALNGASEPRSPYRRMIRMAAAEARARGSPVDAAARTLGIPTAEAERWLKRILETWRAVTDPTPLEPWDYRFQGGAAERALAAAIPLQALQPLNQRYYADLGLDLAAADVVYDLEPRTGKAPLAYSDYVRRGRWANGLWRPTLVRVSASYAHGGIGPLNELVHENGHAAHMLALRTRPAFMDLGDPIFYEAFADVPAWSVYEPAWQRKYLGHSAGAAESLRALYSGVMLDVAWALFDLRMLRNPGVDPDRLWTQITGHYLHIKPHPELSWWAVRVQLVREPGYMVNYGLGAVITADIRQRIAKQLGPFETGDSRWHPWLAEHLLRSGEEQETSQTLRRFLGRPVSPDALVNALKRLAPPATR